MWSSSASSASLECTRTVHLSAADYERIRNSPTRFPIALGHDLPEFETVVEAADGYAVVEKMGRAGEVAAKMDRRSRSDESLPPPKA
jgi:hypothetical protein